MNLQFRSCVAVLFGMVLSASNVFAQEPPQPPAEAETPAAPPTQNPAAQNEAAPASAPVAASPAPMPSVSEPSLVPPAASPLRIDGPNGSSIRIGLLLQPQLQAVSSPTLSGYSMNLYLRRTRILLGGTLLSNIEFFVDTDYPNLFLDNNTGTAAAPDFAKNTPGMNVQDAFVTFKALGDMLKVDAGYMLPPMAHNAVQGATTLYGLDYFSYTFQHNADNVFVTTGNAVGRDAGVQLRGLLVDGHIEYRLGLFQGRRDNETNDVAAHDFFRVTGRLQINLLDAEPGFFYAGTYLGAKKIASIGGSYDFQDKYKYFAADGIVDLPAGPGVVTGQVNLAHWDGGTFIPALAKQTALMGEAGYNIAEVRLNPIVRVERLWVSGADQTRIGGGIAFWPYGHNTNVKAFYAHVKTDGAASGFNQFNLQWQVYFF
jgi:hypothetical protein